MRKYVQDIEDCPELPWEVEAFFAVVSAVAAGLGTVWTLFQMTLPFYRASSVLGYPIDIAPFISQYWYLALFGGAA